NREPPECATSSTAPAVAPIRFPLPPELLAFGAGASLAVPLPRMASRAILPPHRVRAEGFGARDRPRPRVGLDVFDNEHSRRRAARHARPALALPPEARGRRQCTGSAWTSAGPS